MELKNLLKLVAPDFGAETLLPLILRADLTTNFIGIRFDFLGSAVC